MYKITADVETVVIKSAAEKALELPRESILVVEAFGVSETVVHRTGATGWLITRAVPSIGAKGGEYLHADEIRTLFEIIETRGGTLTVLRIGKGADSA